MKALLVVFILFLSASSWAQNFCNDPLLRDVPVLADGRIKPLRVHASDLRKKVLNHNCNISDVELYCLLSLGQRMQLEQTKNCHIRLKVDHEKVMKLLSAEGHEVSPDVVEKNHFVLSTEYGNEEKLGRQESGFALSLARVLTGLSMLRNVEAGEDWKILAGVKNWQPLATIAPAEREAQIFKQTQFLEQDAARALKYEILLDRLNPFVLAIWLGLVAFLLSLGSLKVPSLFRYGYGASALLFVLEIVGMTLRSLASGRAPVTNMYETVMWAGFGILSLGLLLSWKRKDSTVLSMSLGASLIVLFMMKFSTTMLDGGLRPLTPVLRDNFWLSTHVTTITLSYSCFAFAWFIANIVLLPYIFGKTDGRYVLKMNEAIRLVIQVGSVLLAAGIILGGVWADYSWGRFWGWDPKETWSLIALMIYMMLLHGKYAGWFRNIYFTLLAATGFMFVLMAWFGVNYILATGLHSYGFSSGGATFLVSIFISQMLIVLAAVIRAKASVAK